MAIGANWKEIWAPVWKAVWTQTPAEQESEQPTGGWENYRHIGRRKSEEDVRQERIKLGILPPDKPLTLPTKPAPKQVELTRQELAEIEARVKDKVDREIAIYLRRIDKQRLAELEAQEILRKKRIQQTIAIVLILDAA